MDRAYAAGAAGSPPLAPATPSIGYPTAGDPAAGTPAAKPGPYWFHMVAAELLAVIESSGIAPDLNVLSQLASAIQSGVMSSAAAGGTADALTAAFDPPIGGLAEGLALAVRAGAANITSAPTFTPAVGIAAKAIVKGAGAALSPGDIAGAGHRIKLQYDLGLDQWVLLNPASGVSSLARIKVLYFTRDISLAAGSQAITGVGFRPRMAVFFVGNSGGTLANLGSVGFSDGASSGGVTWYNAQTADSWAGTAEAIRVGSAADGYNGDIASVDADGFTMAWVKLGSPTGVLRVSALLIG